MLHFLRVQFKDLHINQTQNTAEAGDLGSVLMSLK